MAIDVFPFLFKSHARKILKNPNINKTNKKLIQKQQQIKNSVLPALIASTGTSTVSMMGLTMSTILRRGLTPINE